MAKTRWTRRTFLRVAPALAIATIVACGPFRRGAGPQDALLVFTNNSLAQADVYVVPQGLSGQRVGTVMAGQTDTLVVPSGLTTRGGTVNIYARLLARTEVPQTGPVSIWPGSRYEIRLPPDARLLSFLPAG